MRGVFLILVLMTSLYSGYEKTLLNLHARLFVRILLLDTELEKRLVEKHLVVGVIYEPEDRFTAERFKKMIQEAKASTESFPYPLHIELISYQKEALPEVSAVYFLNATDRRKVHRMVRTVSSSGRMSFSYNRSYLQEGVMLSLWIGREVRPQMNLNAVRQSGIPFEPSLIQISRHYQKGE